MGSSHVVVRRASRTDVDLVLSASDLFGKPPTEEWTQDFLDRGSNLLILATEDDRPVGMLVAVETSHLGDCPDLFVYGIRVREGSRHRGIAHRLVDKALELAEESGCRRVWGSLEHGEAIPATSPLSPPDAMTTGATTFTIPVP